MKVIKYFLILIFFNLIVYANVNLKSSNTFVKGEPFIFEFEVTGSSIEFPKIEKIDGYIVENIGTSKSLQIINGNYNENISKRFKILPINDFVIPSFVFIIDGKEYKSEVKQISSKKITKTISNFFDLEIKSSKDSLYQYEDLIVTLVFKYKKGLQITNLGFEQPHFNGFWYKKVDNSSRNYEENGYIVQELDFLLFPQQIGKISIPPLRVEVQMIDNNSSNNTFGFFSLSPKIYKIYSNELNVDVKALPKDVNYIGSFEIKASVDKTKINQGESISYKLEIQGEGNFDDIQDIKLDINNATIYENKPEIKTIYKDGKYSGSYTKIFSIVPNNSIKIPPVKFIYFDKKIEKIIEKNSDSFDIEVLNRKIENQTLIKAEETIEKKNNLTVQTSSSIYDKIVFFFLGMIVVLLIIGLKKYVKLHYVKKNKKDTSLVKLVKKSKSKDELIKILVPYLKKDLALDTLIYDCQSDKEFNQIKKELIKVLKSLNI